MHNLSSNHDVPISIQKTPILTHCQTSTNNSTLAPKPAEPLGVHTYLPNGLLQFNPDAPHPVLELIRNAEEEWQKKVDGASRTLEDAVREYKRRYKRAPPQGFDDWWDWAQENQVQLPDEYDTIWRDLEPFWGMDPDDLSRLQAVQETKPDSFTIAKNETHDSHLARTAFSDPETWQQRALLRGLDEIVDLLRPIEDALPPYRVVLSPHDNPNLLSDYYVKKATLDAAAAGEYVDISKLPPVKHLGFASACGPGTPGRPVEYPINQYVRPPPRTEKTFIHDHRLSMDPCRHPYIFYHHAQYLSHDLGPPPQPTMVAQFSYCSTPLYHDIQTPSFISWTEDVLPRENDPEWGDKTDERLLWRGSNTGINHNGGTRWRHAQRIHLVSLASELSGTANVLMPGSEKNSGQVGKGTEMKKALINPAMMDISFSGKPIACDPQYCDYLETQFEWRKVQSPNGKEAGNHKYIIDVDGNGWSSRFKRLITSNSLIFKGTAYPEWWLDRSQPWVHYVPVQVDYSDLYDIYVFFRGGLYGEGNHDDLARKIASAGREWSKSFWRKEDMTAYFFRLLLEYARVMSHDREAMSYHG